MYTDKTSPARTFHGSHDTFLVSHLAITVSLHVAADAFKMKSGQDKRKTERPTARERRTSVTTQRDATSAAVGDAGGGGVSNLIYHRVAAAGAAAGPPRPASSARSTRSLN
ncbi:hypothetical protein EVAR_27853_1 [Eumeta japonica]|uniref:Uncharacterized protein n=1 Tax=Eumeta variegata TaxID=151549 RepID=A0A4C1VI90_EUMVA|nr:hypothetical protein EVAR_27853_1 [Eumeta japonica]